MNEDTGNMFLSIDGIEVEDLEEGDYTAYEEELGVSERMISGRRIEEVRATIWNGLLSIMPPCSGLQRP